ncbi:hypothetical protein, partial [Alteromonas sp. KUL106]|uniref:hypothetical protein n=1 Tax=Alteromonas sp. KUL106 TaxID=2480799 RepID=UPI001F338325
NMGRRHVCKNGEAAHMFASQRATASAMICLLCAFKNNSILIAQIGNKLKRLLGCIKDHYC